MAARQWTTEQKQCIEADGGPLLVSAAAGSGKTAVLVQRILHKITREENPVSIDRLLVVTFTKAAAAEMKQRIAAELSRRMGEHPGDRRLRRQQGLLPRAAISTVDSFCANLVRENFHLLDISPQFRVAEDAETRLLRDEAVGEIIEEAYAQAEPGFLELADMLGNGKNDRRLAEDIEKIYDFIQSHADPEGWLDEKEQAYATAGPLRSTVWADVVLRHIAGVLRHAQALIASAISLTDGNAVLTEKYRPALVADRRGAGPRPVPGMRLGYPSAFLVRDWVRAAQGGAGLRGRGRQRTGQSPARRCKGLDPTPSRPFVRKRGAVPRGSGRAAPSGGRPFRACPPLCRPVRGKEEKPPDAGFQRPGAWGPPPPHLSR